MKSTKAVIELVENCILNPVEKNFAGKADLKRIVVHYRYRTLDGQRAILMSRFITASRVEVSSR